MTLQAQLLQLETALLQPETRRDEARLRQLLAEDFIEFGASGQVWTRELIIQALRSDPPAQRSLHDVHLTLLAPGAALLTYRLHRRACPSLPAGDSLRSSIWQQRQGQWQLVFHQGTPLPAPANT